jgi:hypothetical protein
VIAGLPTARTCVSTSTAFSLCAATAIEQQMVDAQTGVAFMGRCRLHEDALVETYNFFIFKIVKAHVAPSPKHPETLYYIGDGVFMISGKVISRRSGFRPDMLG